MVDRHPKREFLEALGALHPHPERVRAELFMRYRFFDPLDEVQVKYEMLRAHSVDGQSVAAAADAFGFSRQTFYTVWHAFDEAGILGLSDEKRGRRGPIKLSVEDLNWLERHAREHPDLSGAAIAEHLFDERGVAVHRRTVERFLAKGGKKNR